MTALLYVAAVVLLLAALVVIAGQVGVFGGRVPADLGVRDGRFKPPSPTPNSVSSQAAPSHPAYIAPIAAKDPAAMLARIRAVIESMPGARVIEAQPDYLYAQFESRWLKFVDDTEFRASPSEGVVHVRSASRIGRKDFGVNRGRIESIRAAIGSTQ